MHIHRFLQRPGLTNLEAGVGVLTEYRDLAPPPPPVLLLLWPEIVRGVAVSSELHQFLLWAIRLSIHYYYFY